MAKKGKLKVGIFSFTCCEGCQFTILFLDNLMDLFKKANFVYFDLINEKNRKETIDLAFVEGAITTKKEVKKLKAIRKKSKFLVAMGACACHGGIPSMQNFLERDQLGKYVYNQEMLKDSIKTTGIGEHIKVDYYMYGCPIIKREFVEFFESFVKGKPQKEFQGPVCEQCPLRGENCLLMKKKPCLGAVTNGGCYAPCPQENIPCYLCRGPREKADIPAEVQLFKKFGLSEQEIYNKLEHFKNIDVGKVCKYVPAFKELMGKKKK
jgi:sulfhydrogenase subunit delta